MYKYIGRNEETETAFEKTFSTETDALQFGLDKIAVYPDYEVIPWENGVDKTDIEPELGTEYDIDEELEEMGLDEEGQEGFDWSDESAEND
jgi:hypothetical protein